MRFSLNFLARKSGLILSTTRDDTFSGAAYADFGPSAQGTLALSTDYSLTKREMFGEGLTGYYFKCSGPRHLFTPSLRVFVKTLGFRSLGPLSMVIFDFCTFPF